MKRIFATVILLGSTVSAFAAPQNTTVRDVYKTVTRDVPHEFNECSMVEVPIYSTYRRQGSAGEAIGGALLGGAIGHQFGGGSGKDALTVLGAILGARSADRTDDYISGYRTEERCFTRTTYSTKESTVYDHSVLEFEENGKKYSVKFYK